MNIIEFNPDFSKLNLSSEQLQKCGKECLVYISTTNIQVTTCGTKIDCDNVFPQKNPVTMTTFHNSGMTEIQGKINDQPIIALASTTALTNQKLFQFCSKQTYNSLSSTTIYENCKHVKLLLSSKDIIIAK